MIVKILWIIIGLNSAALVACIAMSFSYMEDRNFNKLEAEWMTFLFGLAVIIILLAAVPLYFSQSRVAVLFSGFFALLPLVLYVSNFAYKTWEENKRIIPMSEAYFSDKTQRTIAAAIEKGDVELVKQLIKGQNLNIQGTKVWDADGLNYLQFTCRFRSHPHANPIDTAANTAIIRLLVENGSKTTRALSEGIGSLPIDLITLFLDHGANPNTTRFINDEPLIFGAVGSQKRDVDVAILLVQRGAEINVKNREDVPLLLYSAINSGTGYWMETWRFVRFLIENTAVDCTYDKPGYQNFFQTIHSIEKEAAEKNITMSENFLAVAKWAKSHENDLKYAKNQDTHYK